MDELVGEFKKRLDQFIYDHPALKEPTFYGIWNICQAHESICYENREMVPYDNFKWHAILDRLKYSLKYCLYWMTKDGIKGNEGRPFNPPSTINIGRLSKAKDLVTNALDYDLIECAFMTYKHEHAEVRIVDEFKIEFSGDREELRYDALDLIIAGKKAYTSQKSVWSDINSNKNLHDTYMRLLKGLRYSKGRFDIAAIKDDIAYFCEFVAQLENGAYTLPAEWQFRNIKITSFRKLWNIITTICVIVLSYNYEDIGEINTRPSVIIYEFEYWLQILATLLEDVTINELADMHKLMIYDFDFAQRDPALQPFIILNRKYILLLPHLYQSLNHERNLRQLLARRYENEYSQTSDLLEPTMQNDICKVISKKWKYVTRRKIKGDIPDIDLLIYDEVSLSALIVETKWVIGAGELHEKYSRAERERKGVRQVRKLLEIAIREPHIIWDRCFPNLNFHSDISFAGCVVMREFAGSSHDVEQMVPAVDEYLFTEKIKSVDRLSELIEWMRHREFLPTEGREFREVMCQCKVGPYTVLWRGFKLN